MGARATELLLEQMKSEMEIGCELLRGSLVMRESTAPPAAG
jgi:DNA-binding LacI/PurR family transcriptional regulator